MNASTITPSERILLFAAGTDPELYARCTYTEKNKLLTNGLFVFIPAILAVFSGGFAAPLLFRSDLGQILFPWMYGLLIFVLDRAIMIYVKQGEFSIPQACRIGLALALSFLLAEPLVLFVFDDTLKEAEHNQVQLIQKHFDSLELARIAPLDTERKEIDKAVDQLYRSYIEEADGHSGSGIWGFGKHAEVKKAAWEAEGQAAEVRKNEIAAEVKVIKHNLKEEKIAAIDAVATGVIGKVSTLQTLARQNPALLIISWLVRLILALIDMLPVFLKLQRPRTRAENLYGYLSEKKNNAQMDAAHSLHLEQLAITLQQQKLVAQQQLNASEMAYIGQVAADMQARIALLIEQQKTAEQIHQETMMTIEFQVKNPEARIALIQQLEQWYRDYIAVMQKAGKWDRTDPVNLSPN